MKSSFLFACLAVFCLFSVTIQQTTTPTTTTPPAPAPYTPLTNDQVDKDAAAKGARDYGAPLVIEKAIAAGQLGQDTYTISQTITAAKQVVEKGVNYKFTVTVSNADKSVSHNLGYTSYSHNANGNYFLSKWYF